MCPRRNRGKCFVPFCPTGHRHMRAYFRESNMKIPTLFVTPLDNEKRKMWEERINRKNFPLTLESSVCELHFEDHLLIRYEYTYIGSKRIKILRKRAVLQEDAIPTIFPQKLQNVKEWTKKLRDRFSLDYVIEVKDGNGEKKVPVEKYSSNYPIIDRRKSSKEWVTVMCSDDGSILNYNDRVPVKKRRPN